MEVGGNDGGLTAAGSPAAEEEERVAVAVLIGFGFIWGYLYGAIMNVWFWTYFVYPITLKTYLLTEINALVWDGTRALANAFFLEFFGARVIGVLERFKKRFFWKVG